MLYNETHKIREHYDFASPFYQSLWGRHIHHGYYLTGSESKETAAENLIKLLVELSQIPKSSRVLDVGCGIGGGAIWLAEKLDCRVTGITISPMQKQMAAEASTHLPNKPEFLIDDANDLSVENSFDVIWAVEVLAHLHNRAGFFRKAAKLLVPGGKICEAAWLKDDRLLGKREEKYIREIEAGMLVTLPTRSEYERHFENNNLRLLFYEDISAGVAQTWDICLDIIKNKTLLKMATRHGKEFTNFLKSFKAMRGGFRTGAFRYAVMILDKPL